MLLLALVASAMATAQNPPAPPRAHVLPPDDRARLPLQSTTPISQQFHDLLALAERLDPRQDDFLPEALAFVAERRLGALAQALAADADVADRIVEGGVSAPLIPPDLVIVLRDEPLVVRWPSATSRAIDEATTAPPAPLDGALRAFMAPFDPRDRQIEFSVVAIDAVGDAAYETTALVTAWGGAGDGVRQQNATWRIRWTHAPRGEPPDFDALERELRIAAIVPLDYEEVSDGGPRFVDQTGSVFSEVPGFADILANGTDYWFRRMDSIVGVDLLGHNGLAIGDVNGDGLDDLYLAQAGGLPNALFIQQRDGTVRDVAPAAAVDFLDMTRAALLVDMNNDGHLDLVLSVQNATVVMRGRGDGTFDPRPVLDARTLNMPSQFYSITAADYDSDGWLDLYTVRYVRSGYGVDVPVPLFDAQNGPPNHLISLLGIAPDGSWRFVERSEPAGLNQNNTRFSLAAAWEDFNDNGHPDLYVANDFGRANLYVNDGKRFRDEAEARGAFNQAAGMGVTWADYDRDGRMDLYVTNMYSPPGVRIMSRPEFRQHDPPAVREQLVGHVMGNALFRGAAGGRFERAAQALRHGVEGWGWGAMFVDVNNDGYPDLLVPNGNLTGVRHEDMDSFYWRRVASVTPAEHANAPPYVLGWKAVSLMMLRDYSWAGRQRNTTYLNLRNGHFADISCISGFGFLDDARAVALTDWDGDGALDLWVRNRTAPALRFLRNVTRGGAAPVSGASHGWVAFELVGETCNRGAIGARVTVTAGGLTQSHTLRAGEGYLAQSSQRMHFGLGDAGAIERVTVRWPGGKEERFSGAELNAAYRLRQGTGRAERVRAPRDAGTLALRASPLDVPAVAPVSPEHVVLAQRLALPPLTLTPAAGDPIATARLLGKPYIMLFWSAFDAASRDGLAALAGSERLRELGVHLLPICVDTDHLDRAKAELARVDAALPFIQPDAVLLDLIDLVQQEVLGRPDDLLLPAAFAVDASGMLASVLRGGISADLLAADIERRTPTFTRAQGAAPPVAALYPYGGRVLYPVERGYATLASDLGRRGHRELFDYYRTLLQRLRTTGR